jgi:hypothetical protein
MERAVSHAVRFPDMRLQVIAALRSLSDPQHQQTRWGRVDEGVNYYDDLTMNVHTLYDDCLVLPDPQEAVPDVLHPEEIPIFLDLQRALGPMIQDLGDERDDAYMRDPRWPVVVDTAARALVAMQRLDEEASS